MTRSLLLTAISVIALAACGQQADTANNDTDITAPPPAISAAAQFSDAEFVQAAVAADAFDIQAADLAAARAERADIKTIAATINAASEETQTELNQLAPTIGVAAPAAAIESDDQATLDNLRAQSGEAFDDAFLDAQVAKQQETVRMFEIYLSEAPSGPLRDWAEATLPELRAQLSSVQQIENAT